MGLPSYNFALLLINWIWLEERKGGHHFGGKERRHPPHTSRALREARLQAGGTRLGALGPGSGQVSARAQARPTQPRPREMEVTHTCSRLTPNCTGRGMPPSHPSGAGQQLACALRPYQACHSLARQMPPS